ncbi:hypothetical protein T03_2958 [Trichinella britovi]|uniref:Secreted protein n=1 Tax=Trichinella britovi TaxID=45882 RepID=A0A0V1CEV4_TRIBR|nr:hypothetical protein T03_2958 [Trichinella britovi]
MSFISLVCSVFLCPLLLANSVISTKRHLSMLAHITCIINHCQRLALRGQWLSIVIQPRWAQLIDHIRSEETLLGDRQFCQYGQSAFTLGQSNFH